jgi:hypothetical protein
MAALRKPWYKSATIKSALIAGIGALLSPQVLGVLPPKWSAVAVIVGSVGAAINLRRALP